MDLKSELLENVASCKLKLQLKKKVLQNKPVACYSSHYKPWCPFPVCTLGKGSLFKSRAKEGWGEKKTQPNTFSQWALPKKSLNIHPPAGAPAPAEDFVRPLFSAEAGSRPETRKAGAPAGQRGCLCRADRCCSCMCVYYIIYHPLGQDFSHMKLQISSSLALIFKLKASASGSSLRHTANPPPHPMATYFPTTSPAPHAEPGQLFR